MFAGKALADYEAALAALQQSAEDLKIQDQARSAALRTRNERVKAMTALTRKVVKGVQGHQEYGEDSSLYRAMGFVPFSERRSGLTRQSTGNPGNGEAAV